MPIPLLPIAAGAAAGLAARGIGSLFGKKNNDPLKGLTDENIDRLSIDDSIFDAIIESVQRRSNTQLAERQNFISDVGARGGLSPQAITAQTRGAAIDAQGVLASQGASLDLQKAISRQDAIKFLLQLQQGQKAVSAQRDSDLLGSIGSIASIIPSLFGGGG